MNILHESLLIASAPVEILVGLAIFFCVCAVVLFALSMEAGNYPALQRWFTQLREIHHRAHRDICPDLSGPIWHAVNGGYEYDRAP